MTGYYTHPDCWKHEMGPGHPECPGRLDAIEDRLLITGLGQALDRREAPVASLADIELAHSRTHVAALRGLSESLKEEIKAGGPAYVQVDPDTSMNVSTWDAALRAVGAALAATDAVLAGELENAFCAVRPPGHHAGRDKAMGFCFLNNVAGDSRILMVSFYQHPFYPLDHVHSNADNLVNLPVPAYTKGMEIRELIESAWMPRLEDFRPEMIFISAGFDSHREDDMGQLGLVEQDYIWITHRLKDVARRHGKGRIVSCLEGGYALGALGRSVEGHIRVLADV